jgi:hypothetical protein
MAVRNKFDEGSKWGLGQRVTPLSHSHTSHQKSQLTGTCCSHDILHGS